MFYAVLICNIPEVDGSGSMERLASAMLHTLRIKCGEKLQVIDVITGKNARRDRVLSSLRTMAQMLSTSCNRGIIYYNGHGDQMRDRDGDEDDGKDEYWKLMGGGRIIDDEISDMFKVIHNNSALCLISDSCSSGTMIDIARNDRPWVTLASCYDREDSLTTCEGGVFTLFGLIPSLQKSGSFIDISKNIKDILSIPSQHVNLRSSRTDLPYIDFFDLNQNIVPPPHAKYCAL